MKPNLTYRIVPRLVTLTYL